MKLLKKILLFFVPAWAYIYASFVVQSEMQSDLNSRMFLFLACALAGTVFLSWKAPQDKWLQNLFLMTSSIAVVHQVLLYIPEISNSPWSLSWSEGSRFYYASLYVPFTSQHTAPYLSVLHPTRYMMQSLAFLFTDSSIWFHRFWQVFLWTATTMGTAFLLANRVRGHGNFPIPLTFFAFICWPFLFLMQGPIYYNLLLSVMLVLWGVKPERPLQTLIVLSIASIWAGLSRLNWYPIPGVLSAALYLLEQPMSMTHMEGSKDHRLDGLLAYYKQPMAYVLLGTLSALLANSIYVSVSGNPTHYFSSAFESPLLWYRIFPNPTNRLGILLSVCIVSLPLWLIILFRMMASENREFRIRFYGITTILLILFMGGLIVSVKIGGGSNLHNLDAYLVTLWITGTYYYLDDPLEVGNRLKPRLLAGGLIWFTLLVPVSLTILRDVPTPEQNEYLDQVDLLTLQHAISGATGEVLFMNQRQLITFGKLDALTFVPEYEHVFMMEMAMADNQAYLHKFHSDLAQHRFDYIVSNPLYVIRKGSNVSFGEENDVWVEKVAEKVLCYYEPVMTLNRVSVQVLAPRYDNCQDLPDLE